MLTLIRVLIVTTGLSLCLAVHHVSCHVDARIDSVLAPRAECTKLLMYTCTPLCTLCTIQKYFIVHIFHICTCYNGHLFFKFGFKLTLYSRHLDSFQTKFVFVLNTTVYLVLKYFIVYKLHTLYMPRWAFFGFVHVCHNWHFFLWFRT